VRRHKPHQNPTASSNVRPQHQTQTVELPLSSKSRQPNLDLVDLPILSIHPKKTESSSTWLTSLILTPSITLPRATTSPATGSSLEAQSALGCLQQATTTTMMMTRVAVRGERSRSSSFKTSHVVTSLSRSGKPVS
jgi:hypothetical protein